MREIDYAEWKEARRQRFAARFELESTFQGRAPGRRPRDPEKERVLMDLDLARRKRYIDSGKLQIIGPRRWKWRIGLTV